MMSPIFKARNMLLVTWAIVCLSPFTWFSINAVTLPKITRFTKSLEEYSQNKGKRLMLRCVATDSQIIQFQRNGVTLRNNSDRVVRVSQEKIFIKNVTYETDDGTYRCIAKNEHATVFEDLEIRITTVGEFLHGNKFKDGDTSEPVAIGHGKKLFCPKHTHAYPVKYKWGFPDKHGIRMEKRLLENRRIHILSGGKMLFFTMVTQKDVENINKQGGVSCAMLINGDLVFSRRIKLRVEETDIGGDFEPAIYGQLDGIIYIQTEKEDLTTLHCAASGNPIPNVKWYKDDVEIQVNDSTKYGINPDIPGKLTLRQKGKEVEGVYKCVFTNRQGSASSKANVYIAEPPKLLTPLPAIVKKTVGKMLRLVCTASGTGPLNYTWFRNGSQLSSYTTDEYVMKVKDDVLEIKNMTYTDQGTYQCFVKSPYGIDKGIVVVEVKANNYIAGNHKENGNSTGEDRSTGGGLDLKYIIIIACSASVLLILGCGGCFLYFRRLKDKKQEQFIATPYDYNDHRNRMDEQAHRTRSIEKPIYDFPQPPKNFATDSEDDEMSTFRNSKSQDHVRLMNVDHDIDNSNIQLSENIYFDIANDTISSSATTPSTEL